MACRPRDDGIFVIGQFPGIDLSAPGFYCPHTAVQFGGTGQEVTATQVSTVGPDGICTTCKQRVTTEPRDAD